jgi:hypothetical protein
MTEHVCVPDNQESSGTDRSIRYVWVATKQFDSGSIRHTSVHETESGAKSHLHIEHGAPAPDSDRWDTRQGNQHRLTRLFAFTESNLDTRRHEVFYVQKKELHTDTEQNSNA